MDPTTTAHSSSALHHSQVHSTTAADGTPVLSTGPITPSLDFYPSEFRAGGGGTTGSGGVLDAGLNNPNPVVAKTGVDLSSGTARPAETYPSTGTSASQSVGETANNAAASAQGTANSLAQSANDAANRVSTATSNAAASVRDNAPTVTGLRQRAGSITDTVGAKVSNVTSNLSAQVQNAADHPAVQDARKGAEKQVQSLRERLGRYPIIVDAEKRTGVDRVALVVGGVFLYFLLIPLNLFGLALPTTQLLTFLPPTLLALRTLDKPNEERTKTLLSYFVVFGFVQFAESLMAGFLERKIPQYYTVKLLFLAYLIHPKTKGARKIHAQVFRPLLARAQQVQKAPTYTPPTSKPATGSAFGSPTTSASSSAIGGAGADVPLTRTAGFSGTGPSSTGHAGAPAPASGFSSAGTTVPTGTTGSGAVGAIHLPSGGGYGVGQEVPRY